MKITIFTHKLTVNAKRLSRKKLLIIKCVKMIASLLEFFSFFKIWEDHLQELQLSCVFPESAGYDRIAAYLDAADP